MVKRTLFYLISGWMFFCIQNLHAGADPCSATPLANNMLTFQDETIAGTSSGSADPGCGDYDGTDEWYVITVPSSGSLSIETLPGSVTNAAFALYGGSCGGVDLIRCVASYQCGADPMPKYFFQGLPAGSTVYLRVWNEDGGGGTFSIRVSNPYGNPYVATGTAMPVVVPGSSNCIQLTAATTNQAGCAWYPDPQDFSLPFSLDFNVGFGNLDANGADGICIVFQTNGIPICGQTGGGIAAGGIPNSWIVEFDTWQNPEQGDPPQDHVAININGAMTHGGHPPVILPNIEDGAFHQINITWDPGTMLFTVRFDGAVVISMTFDIINNVFNGQTMSHWGVTASTGGSFNQQTLCFESVDLTNLDPVEVAAELTLCAGESAQLGGALQTEPGVYTDTYVASNGCDSIVHTTLDFLPLIPDTEIIASICEGETFSAGGMTFEFGGNYTIPLTTAEGCDSTVVLDLEVVTLEGIIAGDPIINCNEPISEIAVYHNGSGSNLYYFWSAGNGGQIIGDVSLNNITVDQEGTYFVDITYQSGSTFCGPLTLEFNVEGQFIYPEIQMLQLGPLDCQNRTTILDASGSMDGDIFEWALQEGGPILTDIDQSSIEIGGPGTYLLTVTNLLSGCQSTEVFTIVQDGVRPEAIIAGIPVLNCNNSSVQIDGSGSTAGPGITYEWSTSNGNINGDTNQNFMQADQAGTYRFVVFDNVTQCGDTLEFEILQNLDSLDFTIIDIDTITCSVPVGSVTIQLSDAGTVSWSSVDGHAFTTGNNGTTIMSMESGTYTAIGTNTLTGCPASIDVVIPENTDLPIASAGSTLELNCHNATNILDGSASDTGHHTYLWTSSNGQILQGATTLSPQIGAAGTYSLIVTDTINGCTAMSQVAISADFEAPLVTENTPDTLDCVSNEVEIVITASNNNGFFAYEWSTVNGNIVSDPTINSIQTDEAAWYYYTVINPLNGCTTSDSVQVMVDRVFPIAEAGPSPVIDCINLIVSLNGNGTSAGNQYAYEWTTISGNILSGTNTLNPSVDQPGFYYLQVTNLNNGCTQTDSVNVLVDSGVPVVLISDPADLNCRDQVINILANGSSQGNPFEIYWSTTNGNIVNINSPLSIQVNLPGTYELRILNADNQCETIRTVTVEIDTLSPVADAGLPLVINCTETTVIPDMSGSDTGANFLPQWTTVNGSIISGGNTTQPVFGTPGMYYLNLSSNINYCESADSVFVDIDTVSPAVILQPADILTCVNNLLTLTSAGSSSGPDYQYLWTGSFPIVSPPDQNSVQIDQPGNYNLAITNIINGCVSNAQVLVLEDREFPEITIENVLPITCSRTEVTLTGRVISGSGAYDYEWKSPQGNISGASQLISAEATKSEWYYFEVTDQTNSCVSIDSIFIPADTLAPIVDAGPEQTLTCNMSTLQLSGSIITPIQNPGILWNTLTGNILQGSNTLTPSADRHGWYVLAITDPSNGCIGRDSARILPNLDSIQAADLFVVQPDCFRSVGSITFSNISGGQEPYIYSINGGLQSSTTVNYSQLQPGEYPILVTDEHGCTLRDTVQIIGVTPVQVELDPNHVVELGSSVQLIPTLNLQISQIQNIIWTPADFLDCVDCLEPFTSPLTNIRYAIRVTDENGCEDVAYTNLRVNAQGGVFIPDIFSPGNGDNVNDHFTIFARENLLSRVVYLKIFDRWGNQVFLLENFPPNDDSIGWDGTFRGSDMKPAVFAYVTEVEYINGRREVFFGDVTVFR